MSLEDKKKKLKLEKKNRKCKIGWIWKALHNGLDKCKIVHKNGQNLEFNSKEMNDSYGNNNSKSPPIQIFQVLWVWRPFGTSIMNLPLLQNLFRGHLSKKYWKNCDSPMPNRQIICMIDGHYFAHTAFMVQEMLLRSSFTKPV